MTTPRRRGKDEGSIRQRRDGRWEVRIDLGRGIDGKRRRKSVFGPTEAAVIEKLKKLHARQDAGHVLNTSTPTVEQYLNSWMDTHEDEWKPGTQRGYRGAIDLYLIPAFGPKRLEDLSPLDIQHWLTEHKKKYGARRRVEFAHAVLRSALESARGLQLVATNAAECVTVPTRTNRRKMRPLEVEDAKTFMKAAETHRLGALFMVAMACGLRLGEVTGLAWEWTNPETGKRESLVDLETGEVKIRQQLQFVTVPVLADGKPVLDDDGKPVTKGTPVLQTLKTANSERDLVLPDVCLKALRTHRIRQQEDRLKSGRNWIDTGLVFTTYPTRHPGRGVHVKIGSPLGGRAVRQALDDILDSTDPKLPRVTFHGLRHSAASVLLASGVQLAEISKLLGHSNTKITGTLYAHLLKQTATKAAKIMDSIHGS